MTNVAFLIPAKGIGMIRRRCQNTTIGAWVACQAWSEVSSSSLPWIRLKIRRPKHHPSPWDLLSKIAIAHSSLGRLRDLLPGRPRDLLLSCLYRLLRKKSDNEGGGGFKQLDGGVSLAPHPAAGFRSDPTRPWNSFSSTMSSMKRQRRFSA